MTFNVHPVRLKYRLATLGIACGTQIMRWIAIAHRWLQPVHQSPSGERVKRIAFQVQLRLFQFHNFLFEHVTLLLQKRMRAMGGKDSFLSTDEQLVKLGRLAVDLGQRVGRRDPLDNISPGLDGAKRRGNFRNHGKISEEGAPKDNNGERT